MTDQIAWEVFGALVAVLVTADVLLEVLWERQDRLDQVHDALVGDDSEDDEYELGIRYRP